MWNLPRGSAYMVDCTLDVLRAAYHGEKSEKGKLRLLAAVHRKSGKSLDDIAVMLSKPRRTVHAWLVRLHAQGLDAVRDRKQSGRPRSLSRRQLRALERSLERGPAFHRDGLWTTKLVLEHLRVKYGVEFTPRHLRRILHDLGFSIQKPRPRHYKADLEAQEAFKKTRPRSSPSTGDKVLPSRAWMKARSA